MNSNIENSRISHEEAVKQQMAERFALGELSYEDRARFEAHFFDCQECFENTRLASEFLHHSHKVLTPGYERGQLLSLLGDLWRPVPAVITVLFFLATGGWVNQGMRAADLTRPRQETRVFLTEQTRSPGNEKLVSLDPGVGISLEAGFSSNPTFRSYRVQIVDVADKYVKYTVPLRLDPNEVTLAIVIPPGALREGTYSMIIQGQRSDDRWETLIENNKEVGGTFQVKSRS